MECVCPCAYMNLCAHVYNCFWRTPKAPACICKEFPNSRLRTYLVKKTEVSISDLTEKSSCSTTRCIIIGQTHLQFYRSGPLVSMQNLILVLQLLNVVQLLNLLQLLNVVQYGCSAAWGSIVALHHGRPAAFERCAESICTNSSSSLHAMPS